MNLLNEFKKFAIKGNVVDMAIGIMIGTAFNSVVSSLIADIVMPPLGYFTGGITFSDYKVLLKPEVIGADGGVVTKAVSINYGQFVQVLINFLIIALAMFLAVKVMNMIRERWANQEKEEGQSSPPQDIVLLREIRDLLAKKRNN